MNELEKAEQKINDQKEMIKKLISTTNNLDQSLKTHSQQFEKHLNSYDKKISLLNAKLGDLSNFRPEFDATTEHYMKTVANGLERVKNGVPIQKVSWIMNLTTALVLLSLLAFSFGFYQYKQKAAPEVAELENYKEVLQVYREDNEYLTRYVVAMKKRNPKSHSVYVEKLAPNKHLEKVFANKKQ